MTRLTSKKSNLTKKKSISDSTYHGRFWPITPIHEQKLYNTMQYFGSIKIRDFKLIQDEYNKSGKFIPRKTREAKLSKTYNITKREARAIISKNDDQLEKAIENNTRNSKQWARELAQAPSYLKHKYAKKLEKANKVSVCIGGKKLFKDSQRLEREDLLQEWHNKRLYFNSEGESQGIQGNYSIRLYGTIDPQIFDVHVKIPGGKFEKYGQVILKRGYKMVRAALAAGNPVSAQFIKMGDKYKLHVTPNTPLTSLLDDDFIKNNHRKNTVFKHVGIDFNHKHFDDTLMDSTGNISEQSTINYSNGEDLVKQVKLRFEEYYRLGVETVSIENLNGLNRSRGSSITGNNNDFYRHVENQLPQAIFKKACERNARRFGIVLKLVSPKYTSKLTVEWPEPYFGLTVHLKASYLIGRRGLGLKISRRGSSLRRSIQAADKASLTFSPPTKGKSVTNNLGGGYRKTMKSYIGAPIQI